MIDRNWLLRKAISPFAHLKTYQLFGSDDESSRLVASAINATLLEKMDLEETSKVSRIESIRKSLNRSTQLLEYTDYGAGNPRMNLSEQEMYDGQERRRTVGEVCRNASKPYFWCVLLFKLVREFCPERCLELGTCLGISTAYIAAALQIVSEKKKTDARVVTLEGAKELARIAEGNFSSLGFDNIELVTGRFKDVLPGLFDEKYMFDFVFIDGHHDEKSTLEYHGMIMGNLNKRAVLLYDDISWNRGMKRAWRAIASDDRMSLSIDLNHVGLCIVDDRVKKKKQIRIPLI